MGSIKDTEMVCNPQKLRRHKRWQRIIRKLYKKELHQFQITINGVITLT